MALPAARMKAMREGRSAPGLRKPRPAVIVQTDALPATHACIGRRVGHLDEKDMARLNVALAFVMGLAD
jgi:mRNA-degrading endonuclease toxin of MazEF toxin-antitoxin module